MKISLGLVFNTSCRCQTHDNTIELPMNYHSLTWSVQNNLTHKWDKYGTTVEIGSNHDYMIRLASGQVWQCNRLLQHRYLEATVDHPNHLHKLGMQPPACMLILMGIMSPPQRLAHPPHSTTNNNNKNNNKNNNNIVGGTNQFPR